MLAAASLLHTPSTIHSHTSHNTPKGRSHRVGPRAGTLHSRDTALALRREGLARHHLRHDPIGGMSNQNAHWNTGQLWTPNKGVRGNKEDYTGETPPRDAERREDDSASGARTTSKTPACVVE